MEPRQIRTTLYPGLTGPELLEMAGSIPRVPHWRLNYYRKPEQPREGFEEQMGEHALTETEIKLLEMGLREAQPNLIRDE